MEPKGWNRLLKPIVATGIGCSVLTACTASHDKPVTSETPSSVSADPTQPNIEATCTPDDPATWTPVPTFYNRQRIAAYLGVAAEAVVSRGAFGDATCSESFEIDRISSDTPPVVSVEGKGSPCLAIGIQQTPPTVPGVMTKKILAACANP